MDAVITARWKTVGRTMILGAMQICCFCMSCNLDLDCVTIRQILIMLQIKNLPMTVTEDEMKIRSVKATRETLLTLRAAILGMHDLLL